jgi:ferredoxin-nitrite reductase
MGVDGFIADCEKRLPAKLPRVPLELCEPRPAVARHGHVGFHEQKQAGLFYVGIVLPVGRMTCEQMRTLAEIAERYGSSTIRLTVWQNLLISDIPADRLDDVKRGIEQAGLSWSATSVRGGLVACTGNAGCRFAAANTKLHATQIADHLEARRLALDLPINIHLTGCPHSCAQHFIGDIGLLATKVSAAGDDMFEGYHIYVGGGYGEQQGIGREIYRDVLATDAPAVVERILRVYLGGRESPQETFTQFARRCSTETLIKLFDAEGVVQ